MKVEVDGRLGLPFPKSPFGLCGCKAALNLKRLGLGPGRPASGRNNTFQCLQPFSYCPSSYLLHNDYIGPL